MNIHKITIAIPLYNAEPYVDRCLQSIFKQSFTDYEIIIVNDNSPNDNHDKSVYDIIKSYDTNKITIIDHEQNKGSFQARLTALKNAKTEYICFVDADDWLETNYLEKLYNSITQNNTDIAVSGFYYSKGRRNKMKSSPNFSNDKIHIADDNAVTNAIYKQEIRHCVWNKLYKRKILIDSNVLNVTSVINQSDDLLLNSYAFLEAKSISLINDPLYNYFLNVSSMTNEFSLSTFKTRVDQINIVMKEIKSLLEQRNYFTKFEQDFKNRYIQQCYYLLSILQRGKLSEELYYQGFEHMLKTIDHEYVLKGLHKSPVFKVANLIENKLLPPLTLRRYWIHIIYNKLIKKFIKKLN